MRRVAGKECTALAVGVRDKLAAHPMRSIQKLESEIAADRAAQQLGHDRFILAAAAASRSAKARAN